MFRNRRPGASAVTVKIAVAVTLIGLGAGPALAQTTEKEAIKLFVIAWKSTLASLENQVKAAGDDAAIDLALTLAFVGPGMADDIESAAGDYIAEVQEIGDAELRALEAIASGYLATLGATAPQHFQVGGAGLLDKFMTRIARGQFKVEKILVKFLRKLTKIARRLDPDVRINYHVSFAPVLPPRPNQLVPAAPTRTLVINTRIASSDATVTDDGTLCVGGVADDGAGQVTVTITDPTGATSSQMVTVGVFDGRWRACFTGLTEGNYTIEASQAGALAVSALAVP